MADPIVALTKGIPTSGDGPITTLGQVLDPTNGPAAILAGNSGPAPASAKAMVVTLRDTVVPMDQYGKYVGVSGPFSNYPLGFPGAVGDYLAGVLVTPFSVGCGLVNIFDGNTIIASFAGGGTTPLSDLKPFLIPVGVYSVNANGFKVTLGSNVVILAIGKFAGM